MRRISETDFLHDMDECMSDLIVAVREAKREHDLLSLSMIIQEMDRVRNKVQLRNRSLAVERANIIAEGIARTLKV